jgi:hypothetical protein
MLSKALETLRREIDDAKKNGKDFSQAQEQLSLYYIGGQEEGNLQYDKDMGGLYVLDFIYRDIYAAEEFVKKAVKDLNLSRYNYVVKNIQTVNKPNLDLLFSFIDQHSAEKEYEKIELEKI